MTRTYISWENTEMTEYHFKEVHFTASSCWKPDLVNSSSWVLEKQTGQIKVEVAPCDTSDRHPAAHFKLVPLKLHE